MNLNKIFACGVLVLALVFLEGCATCVVTKTDHLETVEVFNSGLYLFGIPIFSGDPEYPNRDVCSWFTNTVKLETNVRLLNGVMAEERARGVTDVVSYRGEEPLLTMILKRKIYYTSARLVR